MSEGRIEPLYFGPSNAPIFGWWHAGAPPVLDIGVVICAPFGREEISAYRSLRDLACRLAAAGLPVMRFDFAATGDSAGGEDADDLVPAWLADVGQAADELKRLSGVSKIAIVGLRLGAAIGFQAALERGDVSGFVAIAPVLSGRSFARELKALQAAQASGDDSSDGALESGGYVLNAHTLALLGALDLRTPVRAAAPRVLVIDRDDLPGQDKWVAHLRQLGCAVEQQRLAGYADMMLDPHDSQVPEEINRCATDWLVSIASPRTGPPPQSPALRRIAELGALTEEPVWIDGSGLRLSGVLSLPAGGRRPRDAVLLLNAGATRRTGPSRMYVQLARRLAADGMAVLRLDLAGLGDSPAAAGAVPNVVYSAGAVAEARLALDYLKARLAAERYLAAGLCSGAYHALKVAVQGAPLAGIVVINPLTFFWHDGDATSLGAKDFEIVAEAARHRANLFSRQRWSRLLRGHVDLRGVGQIFWRLFVKSLGGVAVDVARALHLPLKEDLAHELRAVAARPTATHFVFAEGDPGERLLHLQGGRAVARMLNDGRIHVHIVANGDHTFTRRAPRRAALALLAAILSGGAVPN